MTVQGEEAIVCMPTWLDELSSTLSAPTKPWSASSGIDLLTAATEMDAWVNDPRTYSSLHVQGWQSAIQDFHASAASIGPQLNLFLSTALTSALSCTTGLSPDDQVKRQSAKGAVAQLRRRWLDPDARVAAWQDLVDACRDTTVSYDVLAARRDIFWQLTRAANYDANLGKLLDGVLADRSHDVTSANISVGQIREGDVTWPKHPRETAGLSETERLVLCRRLLAASPVEAHHVVWLAFENTGFDRITQIIGPVMFWSSQWVRSNVEGDGLNRAELPPELRGGDPFVRVIGFPEEKDVVLARVDLNEGAFTDPIRQAREQAEAVVALASFRAGKRRRWRVLDGYLHVTNGRIRTISSFMSDDDDSWRYTFMDPIMVELEDLATDLASHLPISDPNLTETIGAVHWWLEAKTSSSLPAVILNVRVLELAAARVTVPPVAWHKYLDDYLAAAWIRSEIRSTLQRLVSDCFHDPGYLIPPQHREEFDLLRRQVITDEHDGHFNTRLDKALDALPRLAAMYPRHGPYARRAQTLLDRLTSPQTIDTWACELAHQWTRVRNRLQRVRNALTHGGPLEIASAETVHALSSQLSAWALSLNLEGLLDGRGQVIAHDEFRARAASWLATILSATGAKDALIKTTT